MIINEKSNTVERPVNDHPKCEDLVVTYQMWSLTRVELQEVLRGGEVRTHLPFEETVLHASSRLQCT